MKKSILAAHGVGGHHERPAMSTEQQNREAFAAFVKKNLGDVAVMDNGRYISPKINNYWIIWEESRQRHPAQPCQTCEALARTVMMDQRGLA